MTMTGGFVSICIDIQVFLQGGLVDFLKSKHRFQIFISYDFFRVTYSILLKHGHYCGPGGTDGTPVDGVDACCMTHDHCWSGVRLYCDPYSHYYPQISNSYSSTQQCHGQAKDGTLACNDAEGSKLFKLCQCDAVFADCVMQQDI